MVRRGREFRRLACLSEPASCVRIRALAPQSHSGRVVDLRCVLTYPQLLAGTVADRVGTGGFETCPCRGPVSSLPQTGVSLFGCRYPCEKERLPSTRRFFWAPVPMRVGGGAWLLLWYMRCGMSSADWGFLGWPLSEQGRSPSPSPSPIKGEGM